MNRTVKWVLVGIAAVSVAAGTATAAGFSYVTSGSDETRWGVRVFRRLGVEEKLRAHLVRKSDREQGIPGPLRRYVDSLEGEAREDFIRQHNDKRTRSGLKPYVF